MTSPPIETLRFTTCGSIDDGKSTLIGRLLYESGNVYADQLEAARRSTTRVSVREAGEEVDFSLLTDGLRAEREQGITIDVAYRYFSTARRKFIIADSPGHVQYTRNMATGASTANLAVLLVDARRGVVTQTKRHAFISALLGIRHLIVCVNKMDLVDYRASAYEEIRRAFTDFAVRLDVPDLRFIPISALKGDNVVQRSERMPWYDGQPLLSQLERVYVASDRNTIDLRFPVQLVTRVVDDARGIDFRGYAGQVVSGVVRPGSEVMVFPSLRCSRVSRVVSLDGDLEAAFPPMSVTVCLEDQLDVSRGDVIGRPHNRPRVARRLEAMMVWMGEEPLEPGTRYVLKHLTQSVQARVERIDYAVDPETLSRRRDVPRLGLNEIGRVAISTQRPLLFDPYERNRGTGALILIDPLTNGTVGAGMIIDRQPQEELPEGDWDDEQAAIDPASLRRELAGQAGGVVWLTGLSGSGKSTLARGVELALLRAGHLCAVLDGDAVREGLCGDLGFSPEDRRENIRRVAEAAKLQADAGLVVLVACISPYSADRERARDIVGAERFLLAHVAAPIEECRRRDPKGLYARADAGELPQFTGVSAPYEEPLDPDLRIEAQTLSTAEGVEALLWAIQQLGER